MDFIGLCLTAPLIIFTVKYFLLSILQRLLLGTFQLLFPCIFFITMNSSVINKEIFYYIEIVFSMKKLMDVIHVPCRGKIAGVSLKCAPAWINAGARQLSLPRAHGPERRKDWQV